MTKSIEITKSCLKNFEDNQLHIKFEQRNLKTPCLENKKQNSLNKVRKIDPKALPETKPVLKVKLNPSINFRKGVAPALKPSMLIYSKRHHFAQEKVLSVRGQNTFSPDNSRK